MNKWVIGTWFLRVNYFLTYRIQFNIATEDVELLREDLKYWRTMAVQSTEDKEPPPMILDIYLDTSSLSHNQSLVVADDNLRWGCVELKTADAHHIDRILIESWELTLK